MIIRVRIRNFLSFNKEIEFSMIPGQGRDHWKKCVDIVVQ